VETLECWLQRFGDVTSTADQLHVHKNTLRYRLRRIEEVSGVTLDDPEERFELMLEFRVRQSLGDSHPPDLAVRRGHPQPELRAQYVTGVR
jgi:DNA-binding PucR family transcriptional regulator